MSARVSVMLFLAVATAVYGYPSVPPSQGVQFDVPQLHMGSNWKSQSIRNLRISGDTPAGLSHPDLTQVVTRSPPPASDFNIKQDPPPSEEDLQAPRRRRNADQDQVAAASEDEGEDDDSDMYLEPDEETGPTVKRQEARPSEVVARYEYGLDAPNTDNQGHSQHFFPSFAPVFSLGHSRPPQLFHQQQEPPVYKPSRSPQLLRDFNPYKTYRESTFQVPIDTEEEASTTNGLLGSGNFGVIRGGTYYNDEDRNSVNDYYNNGHGRPSVSNPRPQKYTGGDFFANFRDFADINTPAKAAFSEFVIVYVNKNGTDVTRSAPADPSRPKNIIEQLSLLDRQSEEFPPSPAKKISSHKRKLVILRKGQEDKLRKITIRKKEIVKDLHDPLLALS